MRFSATITGAGYLQRAFALVACISPIRITVKFHMGAEINELREPRLYEEEDDAFAQSTISLPGDCRIAANSVD